MRLHAVAVLGILSVAGAYAGQIIPIEVGQVSGSTNLGLTTAYLTNGCMAGPGNCVAPVVSTFAEANFDGRLFAGAVNSSASPTTPVPFSGYVATGQEPAAQLGGSGAPAFAMISDSATSGANFWTAIGTGTITVPVGLSNVNDVALMLSDVWGVNGAQDTTVKFDFGTSSNGSISDTVTLNLVNSGQGGSSPSGEIHSGVDCLLTQCGANSLANGSPLSSGSIDGVAFQTYNLAVNVFGAEANAFTSVSSLSTYSPATGNLSLEALDFDLGALAGLGPNSGLYLLDVKVTDPNYAVNFSSSALTAITVDTVAPEPSTVFLFLTGLGAIGLSRFRKK